MIIFDYCFFFTKVICAFLPQKNILNSKTTISPTLLIRSRFQGFFERKIIWNFACSPLNIFNIILNINDMFKRWIVSLPVLCVWLIGSFCKILHFSLVVYTLTSLFSLVVYTLTCLYSLVVYTLTCLFSLVVYTLTCLYSVVVYTLTCLYSLVVYKLFLSQNILIYWEEYWSAKLGIRTETV